MSQLDFQVADMFRFVLKECHAALGSFNCIWKKGDLGEAFKMDQSSLSCQSEAFSMTDFSSHQTSLCSEA